MNNSEKLLVADPDARLDTNMKVSEAIERTAKWWEKIGRPMMRNEGGRKRSSGFSSADPDDENYMPSGIINALPWDALTTRERLRLVKHWHHFFVRMPDVIGDPEHEYKFGQRDKIQ